MTMQAILTPANKVAHTRSSPQQMINQGTAWQPVFSQVDSAQLLQTLLNQLAISSQLSKQQIAPSANQQIEQVTPCDAPGFQSELLTLMSRSIASTLVK
jgi:hypothetical protein